MMMSSSEQGATARAEAFAQDLLSILARLPDDADRRAIDEIVSAYVPQEEHTNILEGSLCEHVLQNHTETKSQTIRAINAYLKTNIIDAKATAIQKTIAVQTDDSTTKWFTPALMYADNDAFGPTKTLLFGAEEVVMNGAVVTTKGAGVAAAFARDKGIQVVVVAQAAKFTDSTLLDYTTQFGQDILQPEEIDGIVTEFGEFEPYQAPKVLKLMRESLNQ